MKNQLIALSLITATALTFAPKPAAAGDKEWAAIGGLIGGVIIGNAISESRHSAYPPDRTTTVIVNDQCDDGPNGYWKIVPVKVWVPGYWVEERRHHSYHHGRRARTYVEGRYEYRPERVWVASNRYDHHDCDDRYDRYDRHDRR